METTQPKRISRTIRWARAHKGMISEVTDPELRSQLCKYRNKISYSMSEKEKKDKMSRMQQIAADYEAKEGRKPSKTFLAAIQSQGCLTINDPAILY